MVIVACLRKKVSLFDPLFAAHAGQRNDKERHLRQNTTTPPQEILLAQGLIITHKVTECEHES
ncbi:MAG: hypothetical protein CMP47_15275 [Rickettsiales bacterium]|nr:hypothetical protein [Rickettsiales bacterium]